MTALENLALMSRARTSALANRAERDRLARSAARRGPLAASNRLLCAGAFGPGAGAHFRHFYR